MNPKNKLTLFTIILLSSLFFSSCQSKSRRKPKEIDTSLEIQFKRFELDFFQFKPTDPELSMDQLIEKYPEFTNIYLKNIVQFGEPQDSNTWTTISAFLKDTTVQNLYQKVESKFNTLSSIEKDLTLAVRHVHSFFPELPIPNFYTHLSGFNQSLVIGNSFISVSLDDYMGSKFPYYKKAGIYQYQRQNMKEEKIVPDIIMGWISSEFIQPNINANLLSDCIYRGKILYAVSSCIPSAPDSLILGYTSSQMEWATQHEAQIWDQLVGSEVLFKNHFMTKNHYLNEGPFTAPISQNSPPKLGVYIGWRIVDSYMSHHSDISLQQLMEDSNYQGILELSHYNPKH